MWVLQVPPRVQFQRRIFTSHLAVPRRSKLGTANWAKSHSHALRTHHDGNSLCCCKCNTTVRSFTIIVFRFPWFAKTWHSARSSQQNVSADSCKHSKARWWSLCCTSSSISFAKSVSISRTSLANDCFGICNSFRKWSGSRSKRLCRSGTRARNVPAGCTFWIALSKHL